MKMGSLRQMVRELDSILRGEATHPEALEAGTIEVNAPRLAVVLIVLGLVYGLCMGCYAIFGHPTPGYEQLLASTVKMPLLFFLTFVVTFPSLYVFNALVGSRLRAGSLFRLLIAALGATMALLASFGPIVAFFSVCTTSHPFMVLLNVVVCAVSGIVGLKFLLQTLHRMALVEWLEVEWLGAPKGKPMPPAPAAAPLPQTEGGDTEETQNSEPNQPAGDPDAGAGAPGSNSGPDDPAGPPPVLSSLEPVPGRKPTPHVQVVFRIWVVVFAAVGAQMSWVLRPFVGTPDAPFTWFRQRGSNFFIEVVRVIDRLFG